MFPEAVVGKGTLWMREPEIEYSSRNTVDNGVAVTVLTTTREPGANWAMEKRGASNRQIYKPQNLINTRLEVNLADQEGVLEEY